MTVSGLFGVAVAMMVTSPVLAAKHHRDRSYARHHGTHRFGGSDPDNIGIYGGADFGFLDGPNRAMTYRY